MESSSAFLLLFTIAGLILCTKSQSCDDLNPTRNGCFCGTNSSMCPHGGCALFCASSWSCSAAKPICDFPLKCEQQYGICACTIANQQPTSAGTNDCCSGAPVDSSGKCQQPKSCTNDLECWRLGEDSNIYCDRCINKVCVHNDEKNCGRC